MGIVINLHFRCIICLTCKRAINPSNLIGHVQSHLPLLDVPEDLPSNLESTYNLVPYSSIVYDRGAIKPIFGVPLHEDPIFFCDCGRGYVTIATLRTHQSRVGERECPLRQQRPGLHKGYAQRLTSNRCYFEVDPTKWRLAVDDSFHYSLAYRQSLPPLRDYSTMQIQGAENEMNTSSFFFTQRWIAHLKDYSPADVKEVMKDLVRDAPYGERLRQVGEDFLIRVNDEIKNYNSFGILKLMGQTTEYVFFLFCFVLVLIVSLFLFRRETLHRFDPVTKKTVKKYALTLHRLVYGVLRQIDPSYSHRYRYPALHHSQLVPLHDLREALDNGTSEADLQSLYQAACLSLFAHHQHLFDTSQNLDQFFSPVICFLLVSSLREQGGFQLHSVITQYIAHIMFCIRAVMFCEVVKKSKGEKISLSDAYTSFKPYLTSGHETPMAYYYNSLALLSAIRSDETNEGRFSCTDERGREFSYEGNLIRVDDISRMIKGLYDRYDHQIKQICFFGGAIPESLVIPFKIQEIVDNLQNTQAGYSFLDDPRNPFHKFRSSYGEWLLSDSDRAANFSYTHDGRLVWLPLPCLDFLREMQDIRQTLLLLCIFSAGPSSRASEVARQLLRNVPGSLRNLLILFHEVCLVDIQDKTTHKHLKDKYIPHCPTRKVAALLVYNLAIFRPFEEHLARIVLGEESGLRYHQQLWPGVGGTFSDTAVSDAIGVECSRYLAVPSVIKVSYKILFWRNLVSAILKHQPDARTLATHQQFYVDTAMMHSTGMADARYGRNTSHLPMSDPRQVVECIKVGYAWHELLNIGEKNLHPVDIDEQLENIESSQSGMFLFYFK
jgi:hypothetical protein